MGLSRFPRSRGLLLPPIAGVVLVCLGFAWKMTIGESTFSASSKAGIPQSGEPTAPSAILANDNHSRDENFLGSLQHADTNDPFNLELTDGTKASGIIRLVQRRNGTVVHVAGDLSLPEPGRFFLQKQTVDGKQGAFAGVIEFPVSKTAYRIEPDRVTGRSQLVKRGLDEVVCAHSPMPEPSDQNTPEQGPLDGSLHPNAAIPGYQEGIVSLQSLPGATGVVYLDYRGGYTTSWGGIAYEKPAVSNEQIKDVWRRVAEDFLPFNINVTTDVHVWDAAPEGSRQRVIVTPTTTAAPGFGGVAYYNSWNWTGDTPCWAFYTIGKFAADIISHEVGHTLSLSHDGRVSPPETYYAGHGSGDTSWSPIMGLGYYRPVTQWSKGEYADASNTEDDLDRIVLNNNSVSYRLDDTGSTIGSARHLELFPGDTAFAEGVIETASDTDAFKFETTGGAISLQVYPLPGDCANLAVSATLRNSTGTLIASNNPSTTLGTVVNATVPAGVYTLCVTGAGRNNPLTDGFSSYASLGYYSITGMVAGAVLPLRFEILENSPNGSFVGIVPSTNSVEYLFEAGNADGAFAIQSNGVLTVANPAALDYETLAQKQPFNAEYELFVGMKITTNSTLTETVQRVVVRVLDVEEMPPVVQTAGIIDGNFTFKFSGSVGQRYRVEFTRTLAPPSWQVLTDIVSLASSPFTVLDPATNSQRFYRVGLLP